MASLGSGGGGAAEGSLAAELQAAAAAFHLGRHRKAPPSEIFFSAQRDGAKLFGNLSQSRVVGREIKKPNITNVSF